MGCRSLQAEGEKTETAGLVDTIFPRVLGLLFDDKGGGGALLEDFKQESNMI